jgi:hypothetical protein
MRLDLFWSLISIEKPTVVPLGIRDSGNIDRRGGVSFQVDQQYPICYNSSIVTNKEQTKWVL